MRRPAPALAAPVVTTLVCAATSMAAALALAAPVAAADQPRWQPVPDQPPIEVEACGRTVTVSEEVNRVRELVTETETGTRVRTRGTLLLRLTAEDGSTAVVDASGPADVRIGNGVADVVGRGMGLLVATDESLVELHEEAGLPVLALVKGRVHIRDTCVEETGELISIEFVSLPRPGRRIVDACTLLEPADAGS